MAAIALRVLVVGLVAGMSLLGDQSADVHAAIGALADALSDGDGALAVSSLSKSCVDYGKLSDDFRALAQAYSIHNNIGFVDEDLDGQSVVVTVQWDMTLTPVQGTLSNNRSAEVRIQLGLEGKKWRITEIRPEVIFDP